MQNSGKEKKINFSHFRSPSSYAISHFSLDPAGFVRYFSYNLILTAVANAIWIGLGEEKVRLLWDTEKRRDDLFIDRNVYLPSIREFGYAQKLLLEL